MHFITIIISFFFFKTKKTYIYEFPITKIYEDTEASDNL